MCALGCFALFSNIGCENRVFFGLVGMKMELSKIFILLQPLFYNPIFLI